MANSEIRDSEFTCPKCDQTLLQRWTVHSATITGEKEWEPAGRAYCQDGHIFHWSAAGPA